MKKSVLSLLILLCGWSLAESQTLPPHYAHVPANAGVNNLFFHTSLTQKFQFIYTQTEIAAMTAPVTGAVIIDTIWFRHGGGSSTLFTVLTNLTVRLGHTTLTAPTPQLNSNFNVSGAQTVVSAPSYTYTPLVGAWNVTSDNWTYIALQTPFTYNFTNNLCVEVAFTSSSGSIIGNYANNGGAPITQYAANFSDTVAAGTTARPMFGISEGCPAANPQLGPDLNLCDISSYTLTAGVQPGGTSLLWSDGTNGATLIANTNGTYWVSATNSCGTEYDSIVVSFANSPVVNAGNDQVVCAGQSGQLNGNSNGNFMWLPSSELSATTTFTCSASTYYILTAANGNCASADTVNITVVPTPTVFAGADINANAGSIITLSGSGNGSYNWSPSAGLSCSNCANPTCVAMQSGHYILTVTDINGCTKSDTVAVFVEGSCEISVPNVFTPNGDGINEVIRFDNPCVKNISVAVFNRWGQKLFVSSEIPCVWNPVNSSDGVYYFVLKATLLDETEVEKTGYITLLK
jgi:gliding motility-associated-like protein